ncbi:hypothetical protein PQ478_08260 [Alkalihalophilus pseudofirmus]|uniref:hypothetical protein n=1 Tax=Alkalihalophilus pseudofirmus TaxID=79885 RepID=UPI00259AF0F5|nr:hypothetical protein [Alkalihalophilus pseudofirmus]WEG18462.1 hypothetical protein PQ478_08260 [Alkalihalophilus pseudofirmus]
MEKALFSKRITCLDCKGGHIAKKQRNKRIYICGRNHNYKTCRRNKVFQDYLIELLSMRYNDIVSPEDLSSKVEYIEANEEKIVIYVIDNGKPIISMNDFAQF